FTIEKGQTTAVKVSKENNLTPGSVLLEKIDGKTAELLEGAVFELQDETGKVLQKGLETDSSGKLAIDGLAPGNYQLVETKAPVGYELDSKSVPFTIEKGQKNAIKLIKTNTSLIVDNPESTINDDKVNNLPQTGESVDYFVFIVGILITILGIIGFIFIKKFKK
ncbi:MSCRAMM family protein, partial [Carnobacterium divergens]|uniref:MSCRAMM family protein n=1 Tax=Carnobacterium divergens TaxID=2748 RepID=UPI00289007B8